MDSSKKGLTKAMRSGDSDHESREPRAESREPRAESREPRAESREPRAESANSCHAAKSLPSRTLARCLDLRGLPPSAAETPMRRAAWRWTGRRSWRSTTRPTVAQDAPVSSDRGRCSRLPFELPRLGGRGDGPPAGGHRGGAGSRCPEQGRGRLRTFGPVRAAAALDGGLGRLCRPVVAAMHQ